LQWKRNIYTNKNVKNSVIERKTQERFNAKSEKWRVKSENEKCSNQAAIAPS
jgi:hypothetical protein